MTEMITIIAVGIGLAGLILNGQKNAREDMKDFKAQVNGRLDEANVSLRKEMNVRFDQMDGRLDQMDGRLDQMDGRLDQMDGRLDQMGARFERLEVRMGTMERQQAKLEGLLEGLREAISGRAPASR